METMKNIFPKIRNEKGDSSENFTEAKRQIKCYKQLDENTFDNIDEMDKFLERHQLPKLTQRESISMVIK